MKPLGLSKLLFYLALIMAPIIVIVSFADNDNEIEKTIQWQLKYFGKRAVLYKYGLRWPIAEEFIYRLLPAVFFFYLYRKEVSLKNPVYWVIMTISSFYWAFNHDYEIFYEYLIFTGGLFNSGLIIYFMQEKTGYGIIQGLIAPILAHTEINLIIVSWIILKAVLLS